MKELFKEDKGLGWVAGAMLVGTLLSIAGAVYFIGVLIGAW